MSPSFIIQTNGLGNSGIVPMFPRDLSIGIDKSSRAEYSFLKGFMNRMHDAFIRNAKVKGGKM